MFSTAQMFLSRAFSPMTAVAPTVTVSILLYILSGELEITDGGRKTILHPGDCAFMRRDNRMWLQKRASENKPYRSVVMKFSRDFLKQY